MVGWHGAGEGDGEESAAGVDAAGDVPELSGALRPDLNTMLRPTEAVEASEYTNELSDLALATPNAGWPLDDNPGAQKAIAYLAKQDDTLSPDIRTSYWTMNLDIDRLLRTIGETTYPSGAAFSADDFNAAKAEILQELEWVGKVRSYLDQLSKPFADNALTGWAAVQTIAERIHEQAEADKTKVAVDWLEIITSTFELIPIVGPEVGDAAKWAESFSEVTVTAISLFGAVDSDGEPFGQGRFVTADELGSEMANQARDAQDSFAALGDVIVSDYEKLKELGTYAGCNPSSPDCPSEWGLDKAGLTSISGSLYLDVERDAYLKLLPLGFKVFSLAREGDWQSHIVRPNPPNPVNYYCGGHHPWSEYPDIARSSTSLLQELDPVGGDNEWDTFVFSAEPGGGDLHGTPPPAALLDRMFDPISTSGNPKLGGLGLVWNQFAVPEAQVPEGQRSWWEFNNPVRERDMCHWTG
jgi:hypothetical protein